MCLVRSTGVGWRVYVCSRLALFVNWFVNVFNYQTAECDCFHPTLWNQIQYGISWSFCVTVTSKVPYRMVDMTWTVTIFIYVNFTVQFDAKLMFCCNNEAMASQIPALKKEMLWSACCVPLEMAERDIAL